MRVPQSPKSLRRVMTVSSVRSEDDDGANSSNSSGDEATARTSANTFKKSRPNESSTRPPRPTYTARYKDGKFTVGVEASLAADDATKNDDNNNVDDAADAAKNFADADAKKLPATGAPLPASFHRSRERTRISAVQRLVERKLAQKERERLRERELERDRLSHGKGRSSSSNGCDNGSSYFRERSWDATYHSYHSSLGGRSFSASGCCKDEEQLQRPRTEKENEYLASLLWRTSRSCSGTRRRVPQSDGEEEVAKTIITIGPGKPTRIREHSPSKRSPTSELPPTSFGAEDEEDVDRPTPLKSEHRDQSPSKKSESLFKNSSPLKSTGLFREFAKTTTTTKTTADGKRKTSFTTEKTFQVNIDDKEKARRLSIDCNYVYERSAPTFSTFSQSDDNQPTISSSTSSLTSSFSSTSSADLNNEKEPIRLSRLRPATFAKSPAPESRTEKIPEPPVRERKTSRRIFISTAFNNKNVSNVDDTSSNVSSSSNSSDDSASAGSDGAGSPFSSASSRLLFNLSSGYRYHRAAAAANSALNSNNTNNNIHNNSGTRHININICNKSYNSNDESYPRRRFSQEHLVPEESDTFSGESVFVTRPVRQPVRKISLPVRPAREQRREAARWDDDDFQIMSGRLGDGDTDCDGEGHGDGERSINKSGSGDLASSASNSLPLHSWSKYKLCDDSLFYPGCCVEHDRLSLVEKSSSIQSSSSSSTNNYNFITNSFFSDFGDGSDSAKDVLLLSGAEFKTSLTSLSRSNACSEVTDSSYCSDSLTQSGEDTSFSNETFFQRRPRADLTKEILTLKKRLPDIRVESSHDAAVVDDDDGDDDSSLSTLSGSGIDFFRRLVIHRDQFADMESRSSRASTIKDNGDNLIDRFISDTMLAQCQASPGPGASEVGDMAAVPEAGHSPGDEASEETSFSHSLEGEASLESQAEVSSISKDSSVSGSGLLYLRNYLKKKKRLLTSVRQKTEPEAEVSRPESSLSSEGSTLADILNETFDSEDSELQKLDWGDFDDDDDAGYDFTEDDIGDLESILSSLQISDDDEGVASKSTLKTYRDSNLDPPELFSKDCGLKITVESPKPESFSSSCSTAKNSPSILTLNPPVDSLAVEQMDGFRNRNLSGPEREQLIQSMKENEPVKKLILSSPTTFHPKRNDLGAAGSEPGLVDFCSKDESSKDESSKNRLASFWENRIQFLTSQKTEVPVNPQTSFRPAMPSYYSPEVQSTANERIRMFLEVTRKAAEAFETSKVPSTSATMTMMTAPSTRVVKLKSY